MIIVIVIVLYEIRYLSLNVKWIDGSWRMMWCDVDRWCRYVDVDVVDDMHGMANWPQKIDDLATMSSVVFHSMLHCCAVLSICPIRSGFGQRGATTTRCTIKLIILLLPTLSLRALDIHNDGRHTSHGYITYMHGARPLSNNNNNNEYMCMIYICII